MAVSADIQHGEYAGSATLKIVLRRTVGFAGYRARCGCAGCCPSKPGRKISAKKLFCSKFLIIVR